MAIKNLHGVPLAAISKGRHLGEVLEEYMRIWNGAQKAVTVPGKGEDEIFADTMKVVTYRLYLLGVEDGMKGAKHERTD